MLKILVIEDDQLLKEGIREILLAHKFKVFSSSDGVEGLELTKELLPDLIVCDIMMPKMDGYELKDELNKEPETSSIPFIFLTAKAEMSDLRKGMELGADDFLIKPFKAETLIKAILLRLKKHSDIKSVNKNPFEDQKKVTAKVKNTYKEEDRILITVNRTPQFIKINQIKCIISEGNYTKVHLAESKKIIVRKNLTDWFKILPEKSFKRIHRSTIINLDYVEKISNWSSGSYIVYIKEISNPFIISQRYAKQLRSNFTIR